MTLQVGTRRTVLTLRMFYECYAKHGTDMAYGATISSCLASIRRTSKRGVFALHGLQSRYAATLLLWVVLY